MKVIGCYRDEKGEIKEMDDKKYQKWGEKYLILCGPPNGFDVSWGEA
ncbi:hypothetical protein [Orenia marismortui]|uniref:Uncharacterized protein n=1 Tax=Orenia marismortui TaxID=46469 RepID=A0A4R8H1T1_9FIRM|nr:hypothetical protein [Orenia marismortui]TDX52169.1 hypothetical protein C7959_10891 [Orenia marismortui]